MGATCCGEHKRIILIFNIFTAVEHEINSPEKIGDV